jgi:hypothetical protein
MPKKTLMVGKGKPPLFRALIVFIIPLSAAFAEEGKKEAGIGRVENPLMGVNTHG